MDSVLVLTSEAYYVADYDETSDRLLGVQRVPLADVTAIELGPFDANVTTVSTYKRTDTVLDDFNIFQRALRLGDLHIDLSRKDSRILKHLRRSK